MLDLTITLKRTEKSFMLERFIVRKRHSKEYHLMTIWEVSAFQFIVNVVIKCHKTTVPVVELPFCCYPPLS